MIDQKIDRENLSDEDIEDAEARTYNLLLKFFGIVHELIKDPDPTLYPERKFEVVIEAHEAIGTAMTAVSNDLEIKATGKMVN